MHGPFSNLKQNTGQYVSKKGGHSPDRFRLAAVDQEMTGKSAPEENPSKAGQT
jgi:hypothetical protein